MGEWRKVWYPARKKVRHFTAADVARISKYAVRDGASAVDILAYVAVAIGMGALFCKAARSIRSALSLTAFLNKVFMSMAVSQFIALVIQVLIKAKVIVPPQMQALLAVTISGLWALDKVTSVIETLLGDRAIMQEITSTLDNLCKKVSELTGEVVDAGCDATGDACKQAQELAHDAVFALKSDVDKAWYLLVEETWWQKFWKVFGD